jgi:hypothetical protein
MQVLDDLKVVAPAIESQVSGTDEEMAVLLAEKHRDLGMEDASSDGDGFDLVVPPSTLRALLREGGPDAVGVGQDERFLSARTHQSVENDGFEERQAESVRCKRGEPPWMSRSKFLRPKSQFCAPSPSHSTETR